MGAGIGVKKGPRWFAKSRVKLEFAGTTDQTVSNGIRLSVKPASIIPPGYCLDTAELRLIAVKSIPFAGVTDFLLSQFPPKIVLAC